MANLFEEKKINNYEVDYLSGLDNSQKEAVTSEYEKVLLRAPAGSGKTSSLIAAIVNYRYNWLGDKICAITYTRAARAEMQGRLQELGIYDVDVTTIHVWARNLLDNFARKYDFKINVLEEKEIKALLKIIADEYLLTHRQIKYINIEILYNFINGNKNMDVSDNYKRTLIALEERYIQYKRDNGLYDFTDYPLYLYDIINAYDETIYGIDALFVDEFQDVDSIQYWLFDKVKCKKKFFVGDEKQSIFQFRGADGKVFDKAKDFNLYELKYNYRSKQEIINYANTVYDELKDCVGEDCYITQIDYAFPNKNVTCDRGNGGNVYVINSFGECVEVNGVQKYKVDIRQTFNHIMSKEPMILCRKNKEVKEINKKNYFNVSTIHQAKGLEYEDVIVIDSEIQNDEDLNVAYVALTRAKNNVLVMPWNQFEMLYNIYLKI